MRSIFDKVFVLLLFLNTSIAMTSQAVAPSPEPPYWQWAETPPMGWNSYDVWGTSITIRKPWRMRASCSNVCLAHGWEYII